MTITKIIMKQHDGEFAQLISFVKDSKCQVVSVVIKHKSKTLSIKKVQSVLQIMWMSFPISLKCRKICVYIVYNATCHSLNVADLLTPFCNSVYMH